MRAVTVVGAGPTGATAAHQLAEAGWRVRVLERSQVLGGHTRTEWIGGVPYEPNGAHLFHTSHQEVWSLVTRLVEMIPYRHRVLTRVGGRLLSWPIQLDEVKELDEWPSIEEELRHIGRSAPSVPPTNFEQHCVSLMGETLYRLFVEGYTRKQWGCDPKLLSASIAPKRVELRTDGVTDLFRDPFQGWPVGGYGLLCERLLDGVHEVGLGIDVSEGTLAELVPPGEPVVLTCALDGFFADAHGPLDWRGVELRSTWHPTIDGDFAQDAMVINEPSPDVPYTRTVESKHVLAASHLPTLPAGTVVSVEHPGAPAKHYPVLDAAGRNADAQEAYLRLARGWERNPLLPAGRLATYRYINMDEAMLSGMQVAAELVLATP